MLILWPDGTISTESLVSGSQAASTIKDGFKNVKGFSLDSLALADINPNDTVEDVLMQLVNKWSRLR